MSLTIEYIQLNNHLVLCGLLISKRFFVGLQLHASLVGYGLTILPAITSHLQACTNRGYGTDWMLNLASFPVALTVYLVGKHKLVSPIFVQHPVGAHLHHNERLLLAGVEFVSKVCLFYTLCGHTHTHTVCTETRKPVCGLSQPHSIHIRYVASDTVFTFIMVETLDVSSARISMCLSSVHRFAFPSEHNSHVVF